MLSKVEPKFLGGMLFDFNSKLKYLHTPTLDLSGDIHLTQIIKLVNSLFIELTVNSRPTRVGVSMFSLQPCCINENVNIVILLPLFFTQETECRLEENSSFNKDNDGSSSGTHSDSSFHIYGPQGC